MLAATVALFVLLQRAIALVPPLGPLGGLRDTEFLVTSRMLAQWGRPKAAADQLREGLAVFPGNRQMLVELALAEGMDRQGRGDYDGALEAWRRALALEPNNPLARLGLATAAQRRPLQPATPVPPSRP
jgi:tetratricopeptide (TPR) repeat protein